MNAKTKSRSLGGGGRGRPSGKPRNRWEGEVRTDAEEVACTGDHVKGTGRKPQE
jgi:hypothetical protein